MDGAPHSSKASKHTPLTSPGHVPAAVGQPWLLDVFKKWASRSAWDPKPYWHCPQGCSFPGQAHRCVRGSDRHLKPLLQQLQPCILSVCPACCWLRLTSPTMVFPQLVWKHHWDPG